jgi:hypothetical protein
MMTETGSSSTQATLGSSTNLNGHIVRSERSCRLHEETNNIPRLGDIWLCVNSPFLQGGARFFKPKHSSEFRKGDKIIRVELLGAIARVLSWKFAIVQKGDQIGFI